MNPNTIDMRSLPLLVMLFTTLFACKKESPATGEIRSEKAESPIMTPEYALSVREGDTLTILQRCAVQFVHDTIHLEDMHRKMGDDYYTVADDANFYNAEATAFLDSVKLPLRYVKNVKYIEFQNNHKMSLFVKTDTLSLFNFFLFDSAKPLPKQADITNIREEYRLFSEK